MDFRSLDVFSAVMSLYGVAFVWQYVSHHIRFLMIKYYLRERHYFISLGNYGIFPKDVLHSLGVETLGISRHRTAKRSYSWLGDITYFSLSASFPFYLLSLTQEYLRCNEQALNGMKKILQEGEAGKSFSLFVFWILFCGVFPHFWAIYFNRKRYKYYLSEKGKATWINPNLQDV